MYRFSPGPQPAALIWYQHTHRQDWGQTDRQKEKQAERMTEMRHNVAVTPVAVGLLGQCCVTGTLLVLLVVCELRDTRTDC